MFDLILEFIHHLAVFSLVGVLAAEYVLAAPGLSGRRLQQVGVLDGAYGGLAGVIIIAGFVRAIWGEAGWEFYAGNWVFWAKIGLFILVGLVSIRPTITIFGWRRAAKADPDYAVPANAVSALRPWFLTEFALLALIPIFAAMMARGIGL